MENNYSLITDEKLAAMSQDGNLEAEEFLIRKYKKMVKGKAHIYFIAGADSQDVVQEGMIGLFKAIRDYNKEREASFRTFAELCVNRQIISAIKTASRMKHSPLNYSISLNGPISEEMSEQTLEDIISSDNDTQPENMLVFKDILDYIINDNGNLFSDFELHVWNEYIQGKSYTEIASLLGKSPKAVDNAMQRTKKKIISYIRE